MGDHVTTPSDVAGRGNPAPSIHRARRRLLSSRAMWGYVFASPAILFLIVFAAGPILFTFWVSVHNWNLIEPVSAMPWVGLDNYRYLLTKDSVFRQAMRNTVIFTLFGVSINTIFGLLGALVLNTSLRGRALWRTLFFLPMVTAPLALGMMWAVLLNKNYGLINMLLIALDLPRQPFLASTHQALACIISVAVYQYVGYYIIIYLAGLQGIPQDYYDAASVDGANALQSFWHITLPLLRPVLLFIIVTNTIGALQVFDIVFAATAGVAAETSGGGPAGSTMVVVLHMYNTAFKFFRMGRAAAMAVLLGGIIFVVTFVQLRLLQEKA